MPIYCDESGFTGNNMLNEDQPYFSYVGVNLESDKAMCILEDFVSRNSIRQRELKCQSILSRGNRYKSAVNDLFVELLSVTKFAISLKKFSLACNFFEYIFEPILSEVNSLFYESGFHTFISNVVYFNSIHSDEATKEMLMDFENFMRNKDENLNIFKQRETDLFDAKHIIEFASIHKDAIISEFQGIGVTQKWILDNSLTMLYNILCSWTEEIGSLTVICDDSKPLLHNSDFFKLFVNRKDQFWQTRNGNKWPLIVHLCEEISFKASNIEPGLQLADIMASIATYSLKNMHNCEYARKWFQEFSKQTTVAIVPNIQYFLTSNVDLWRNTFILEELVERSKNKLCLTTGIGNIFNLAHVAAQIFVESQTNNE